MTVANIMPHLQRAQALLQAGRAVQAWPVLAPLRAAIDRDSQALRLYALVAQGASRVDDAAEALKRIAALESDPPEIIGALADLLGNAGRHDEALKHWDRLVSRRPDLADAHLNRAISAANAGRHDAAVEAADEGLERFPGHARLLATKAMALKNAGRITEAVKTFEKAVAADPRRALTRHNQAVALRAACQFDEACEAYAASEKLGMQGAQFHANWAAAALEAGKVDEAIELYHRALRDDGKHDESLQALTRVHIEYRTGHDPFGHYQTLARKRSWDPDAWAMWANALAVNRRYGEAAGVAAEGLKAHSTDSTLQVLEEFACGMSEEPGPTFERLERRYRQDPANELLWLTIQQLGLRSGRPDVAAEAAARLVTRYPHHQSAWSILSLAWRLLDDPREHWLCDYDRLVMVTDVGLPEQNLDSGQYAQLVGQMLLPLHTTLEAPGNQSLRHGTQTGGALFDKPDAAIQQFRLAVSAAAANAVSQLPDDPNHPFLSRKATTYRFSGSWSVRLKAGGGHHVPHFHSEGWMSSAYYARLPQSNEEARARHEGWIEFGRSPEIFRLCLEPRRVVEPRPGRLVLFPSYMWHGTLPFREGERLTAAFDYLPA